VLAGSEQRDDLQYDADGTGWQGRSILSSIGGSQLGTSSSSAGSCRTTTTKGGAVIGCAAPTPPQHELFRARRRAAAAADGGFSDEGDDDEEEFHTDVQLALALRAVNARHGQDLTLTQLGKIATELVDLSSRRMIEMTIALIKHEETEAARGHHVDNKPTTSDVDDGTRGGFAVGAATELGVPREVVRVTAARTGSVIVSSSRLVPRRQPRLYRRSPTR
jgi:hypothetical protein